jgi:hypothetical protein
VASAASAIASPASAHGFGQRYDLPLPLSLYLYGTAAVVVLSFVVFGFFVRRGSSADDYPRLDLLAHRVGRAVVQPGLVLVVRLAALALFALTIVAGLVGRQDPYRNIAPTLVWIIVWVGLAYVSAFVADLWAVINPWRTAFEGLAALSARIAARRERWRRLPYPEPLGVWPAVALLIGFSWFELVYPTPAVPAQIAWLAIGYSVLTWSGMAMFGRETWLKHGEVFSVVFATFARFAPIEPRMAPHGRELALRPFGAGLLHRAPASPSMTAFVLLLLSTVLYDGLLSTPEWSAIENAVRALLRDGGDVPLLAIRSVGLVAFWLLFLAAYTAASAFMSAAAGGRPRPSEIAQSFAFTLLPIAIGYHLAHYLVFLLVQGQYIVPLISDPFGFGWDLFGTAGYRVKIAVVGARFAWYAALAAILTGHVAAVYFAHAKAMQVLGARRATLRSQVPLTALMVLYTVVSLSILAEPLVEQRAPARPSAVAEAALAVPADAVLPEPGSGRLQPVGPDRLARAKMTFGVLGSAFHDGTRTSAADLLYAYAFAYRWGVRGEGADTHYDPAVDAATASLRRQLVALRVAGVDSASRSFRIGDVNFVRELLTLDVYTTIAPEDLERDGIVVPPWSTLPWHLVVLMEEAVTRGWAAFSMEEAARRGVEWLDLVRSERLNARLAALIETFERDAYRPAALQALVSADEAGRRWAALAEFYKSRGHFLVANGPYRLKRWSKEDVALEAFRDLTYPLGVGSYDAYAVPRRGYITKIEREDGRLRIFGDIETVVKFARSQRIEREPMQSLSRDVLKRAAPECRYVVTDENGRVVAAGSAALAEDATFRVDLEGKLAAGRYVLLALIAVGGNVMNPEIQRLRLEIPARP